MKNLIKLVGDEYKLFVNGEETTLKLERWFEKKTGVYHVKLPKDNPTGRTYIRESLIGKDGYSFDDKTTPPRKLDGMGWRSRLTPEETQEIEKLETRFNELKEIAMSRKPETEADILRAKIAEYEALLGIKKV